MRDTASDFTPAGPLREADRAGFHFSPANRNKVRLADTIQALAIKPAQT